jgi:rubrerythrin
MDSETFVRELDAENRRALDRIRDASTQGDPAPELSIGKLLGLALKNELEATECAAAWIGTTPELDVKLALARQAGDEAKHLRLIQKRLAELGAPAPDPTTTPRSKLLQQLIALEGTVARVAAGQFTREALALVRNEAFIAFCETKGDTETAKLYRDVIQPDEKHHHELGRSLLQKLATTDELQAQARAASQKVLALAEELQEIARLEKGITRAPGC